MDEIARVLGWLTVAVYAASVLYAAISDIRSYEIPNWVSLVAFVCFFPVAWAAGWSLGDIGWNVGAATAVLGIGFILYVLNVTGAGDVKLLAATSVFGGWTALIEFLVIMALAGGVLAVVILVLRRVPVGARLQATGWLDRLRDPKRGVPYGVAIAAAALYLLPYLPVTAALRAV